MKIDNFLEIFNGGIESNQYLKEYHIKRNNFLTYEDECEQIDFTSIIKELKNTEYGELLIRKMKEIHKEILYPSYVHGIRHNQKVAFLASYIALKETVPIEETEILIDGAFYHDIGRINDEEDDSHGPRGAKLIEKVVNYSEKKKNLLKAIITIHSIHDREMDCVIEEYRIQDKEKAKKIAKILKDSDGLDRIRLKTKEINYSYLDPKYLRTQTARKMIRSVHQLNEWYEDIE